MFSLCFTRGKKIKNKVLQNSFDKKRTQKEYRTSAFGYKGSITIEAALVLPIFMIFTAGLITILSLLSFQSEVQEAVNETAKSFSRKAYIAENTKAGDVVINTASISAALLGPGLGDIKNDRHLQGGFNPLMSTYDAETGIIDVVVTYDYKIHVLPENIASIPMAQRMRMRAWVGRKLDTAGSGGNSGEESEDGNGNTVYVTETGTVYHTSKNCTYLDLSIHQISYGNVSDARNKSGGKYYGCPLCSKGAHPSSVYITDYGENWHTSLSCSGLKRTVSEKDISDVGDLPLCSKCGGKH